MANAVRGEVDLELAGKHYKAKFDYTAVVLLETYFGSPTSPKPIAAVFTKDMGSSFPLSMIPIMLWATLHGSYPEEFPTMNHVAKLLELDKTPYYSERVAVIFQLAKEVFTKNRPPMAPAGVNGAAPTTAGSTGTNSSAPQAS